MGKGRLMSEDGDEAGTRGVSVELLATVDLGDGIADMKVVRLG